MYICLLDDNISLSLSRRRILLVEKCSYEEKAKKTGFSPTESRRESKGGGERKCTIRRGGGGGIFKEIKMGVSCSREKKRQFICSLSEGTSSSSSMN